MRNIIKFLSIFALLMLIGRWINGPDWETVDSRAVTASSCYAWEIAKRYCPEGMDVRDYCDRVRAMNPHIAFGETVFVPVCEVSR